MLPENLQQLDELLTMLRRHGVANYQYSSLVVQFGPAPLGLDDTASQGDDDEDPMYPAGSYRTKPVGVPNG